MVEGSIGVKEEFDNNFKALEEKARKKTELLNTLLMVLGVFLFVSVLIGTLFSYNNYIKAKENSENIQVIEFK